MSINIKLNNLANHLDSIGLTKEADYIDGIIKRYASDLEGDDDFEPEQDSGPLKVPLPPGSVKKAPRIIEREFATMESMGFSKNSGKPSYRNTFPTSVEDVNAAEPLAKSVAQATGHVYVTMNDDNYSSFTSMEMIDGKPGLYLQDVVGVRQGAPFNYMFYNVHLKTYDENKNEIYYVKTFTSIDEIKDAAEAYAADAAQEPFVIEEIDDRQKDMSRLFE